MLWTNILGMGFNWFPVIFWGGVVIIALLLIKLILGGEETKKEQEKSSEVFENKYSGGEKSRKEYAENIRHIA